MNPITPHALTAMIRGKGEGEMVYVRVKDPTGHRYEGRIMDLVEFGHDPKNATVTIEATDGEVVHNVMVSRIEWYDVRPFQRFDGYTVAQFVADFGQDVS